MEPINGGKNKKEQQKSLDGTIHDFFEVGYSKFEN